MLVIQPTPILKEDKIVAKEKSYCPNCGGKVTCGYCYDGAIELLEVDSEEMGETRDD